MDPAAIAHLHSRLGGTRWAGIHFLDEVGSTQDAALNGPRGCRIFWADRQTAGRGRQGRVWHDGGRDLAVTFRLEDWCPERPELLALAVPLAVVLAAESVCPSDTPPPVLRCKWPNDVLASDAAGGLAKLAGVLIDGSAGRDRQPVWRIGIGINVNRTTFPRDLDQPATSLAHLVGRPVERGELLVALATSLDEQLERVCIDPLPLLKGYRERLLGMGRVVQVACDPHQPLRTGRLLDVELEGLRLEGHGVLPLAQVTRILC